ADARVRGMHACTRRDAVSRPVAHAGSHRDAGSSRAEDRLALAHVHRRRGGLPGQALGAVLLEAPCPDAAGSRRRQMSSPGYGWITAAVSPLSRPRRYPWVMTFSRRAKGVIQMKRRRLSAAALLILVLGLGVIASGCGGSAGRGVAQAPNAQSTNSGSS